MQRIGSTRFHRTFHASCRQFATNAKESLDAHKFTKEWRIETLNFSRGFSAVGLATSMITFYYESSESGKERYYELSGQFPTLERSLFVVGIWTLGAMTRTMFVTTRNAAPMLKTFVNAPILSGIKFGAETAFCTLAHGVFIVSLMSIGLDFRYRYNTFSNSRSWNLAESPSDDASIINLNNAATLGATTGNPTAGHGSAEAFTEILPESFEDEEGGQVVDGTLEDGSGRVSLNVSGEPPLPERIDFDFGDLLERTGEATRGFLIGHGPVFLVGGCLGGATMVRFSWARWKVLLDRCRAVTTSASSAGSVVRV